MDIRFKGNQLVYLYSYNNGYRDLLSLIQDKDKSKIEVKASLKKELDNYFVKDMRLEITKCKKDGGEYDIEISMICDAAHNGDKDEKAIDNLIKELISIVLERRCEILPASAMRLKNAINSFVKKCDHIKIKGTNKGYSCIQKIYLNGI